jgi:hypothetical protein
MTDRGVTLQNSRAQVISVCGEPTAEFGSGMFTTVVYDALGVSFRFQAGGLYEFGVFERGRASTIFGSAVGAGSQNQPPAPSAITLGPGGDVRVSCRQ